MNLLAHLYLSGNDDYVILGNFFADAVKGRQYLKYDKRIQHGIMLHRAIDDHTDHHPMAKRSVKRLQPEYHKYAAVIIDLVYDHFLALNWNTYAHTDINAFINHKYALLLKHYNLLPQRTRQFVPFMILNNWLKNYMTLEGLHLSLEGLSRRTAFESKMEFAIHDVKIHYQELHNDFNNFFPDITAFANEYLLNGKSTGTSCCAYRFGTCEAGRRID
ncbi:MAG: ACP phosphodiesterase [Bacteroidales bacterium]